MKKVQSLALALAGLLIFTFAIHSCTKQSAIADKKAAEKNSVITVGSAQEINARTLTTLDDTTCSCGKYYTGTHAGTGFYVYPDITLNLTCRLCNSITIGCTYYDVPNRFTIYDKNGSVVTTSNWIGWAHCSGPWGMSVTTAQAETFINFTYNSSLAPYKLRVETSVVGCSGCSTDPGCTDHDDNWQAHVLCCP